jgi:ribosomal protein S18 acetylase RimI-like enzyme
MTPASDVAVQRATPADQDVVAQFMAEYYAFDHLRYDPQVQPSALAQLLEPNPAGEVYLLTRAGVAVGYMVLIYYFSLEFGGQIIVLDELYLRPEARGCGLGRAALAFAHSRCQQVQACCLRLEVERSNLRAAGVYKAFGFTPEERNLMSIRLP